MRKVLIIEDDQIVANIYRNKLSQDGFQVEVAFDAETGLDLSPNFQPNVIVLDLLLPKMSGVDFMKKIRVVPGFEKTPIIVFSNTYLTNMVQDAWKAGATKCLSKANCTPKQVIEVVRGLMPAEDKSINSTPVNSSSPAKTAPAKSAGKISASEADAEFQAELRLSFCESLPATLLNLRTHLQALIKGDSEENRLKQLHELSRKIHALANNAGISGMTDICQMAEALEALLKELHDKPKNINASTLRTVASAIDFLGQLFQRGQNSSAAELPSVKILVVDDEVLSRRAITYALEKAKLQSVNVEDPVAALKMLTDSPFDLVFLDVDMPNMTGFELCAKLRTIAMHKKTPVIFVTSLNDLESRTNSTVSGGNDFIAKPFLFIELAVKSLVYVLRSRFQQTPKPAPVAA